MHHLPGIAHLDPEAGSIAEVRLDYLGAPTGNQMELANPHFLQPFDNVLQDGTPLHLQHGFGDLLGEVAHAGSLSGGEDDSLGHDG